MAATTPHRPVPSPRLFSRLLAAWAMIACGVTAPPLAAAQGLADAATPDAAAAGPATEPPEPAAAVASPGPTLFSAAWTGTLAADTRAEDPGEDVLVARNRLDLDLVHPATADLRVHLAGRLWHRAAVGHEPGAWTPAWTASAPDFGMRYDQAGDLREANLQRTWDQGRLTFGREVVRWGALELASPLAILCPMDFSQGLAGALTQPDEPPILPTWMVRWEQPLGPGRIDAIYLPFFEQHRISPFATDAALVRPGLGPEMPAIMGGWLRSLDTRLDRALGESLMLALKPPSATPLDGSLALRWSSHLGAADVALVTMLTWDRMPELNLNPDLLLLLGKTWAAGFDTAKLAAAFADPAVQAAAARAKGLGLTDLATARWHRRGVVGGELQWEVRDGWVVRADLAWSHQKVLMDINFRPILSPLIQTGIGAEHSVGDWLTVLAEATWAFAYAAPTDRPLLLAARHQLQVGGGGLLRWGEAQEFALQLGGFYGISLSDWAFAPRATWAFSPGWRVGVGGLWMGGPINSPGGMLAHDDQVLVELRRAW